MPRSTDLYKFLDNNGDGTGTVNAVGDYSSGENFYYTVPDNVEYANIARMIVYIEDSGNFSSNEYGGLPTLSNGVEIKLAKQGETIFLTDERPIVSNARWGEKCYDVNYLSFGSGNNQLLVRWTFANSGKPVVLRTGEKFIVFLNDNLSGLVEHTFMIQGQVKYK